MGCAATLVTIVGGFTGEALLSPRATDYLFAAIIAVGPGLVGWGMITWALTSVPALVPALARLATPFISAVLAWWLLAEGLGVEHFAGAFLTCLGVGSASLVMYRDSA
jgi:drug/metabolite transporter (DMT)-like permease